MEKAHKTYFPMSPNFVIDEDMLAADRARVDFPQLFREKRSMNQQKIAGEDARVEVKRCASGDVFWLDTIVNGRLENSQIHVPTLEDGMKITPELEKLIVSLYRRAYRDGYRRCQADVRNSLGIRPS